MLGKDWIGDLLTDSPSLMVMVGTVSFDRVASDRIIYDWPMAVCILDKAVQLWAKTQKRTHDARPIPRCGRLNTRYSLRRDHDARSLRKRLV
jgi:hypothetical protein